MGEMARKKRTQGRDAPATKGGNKDKQKMRPAKSQKSDSEDIERAVYDGMQDLRAGKT
jgi:hypothetical protein